MGRVGVVFLWMIILGFSVPSVAQMRCSSLHLDVTPGEFAAEWTVDQNLIDLEFQARQSGKTKEEVQFENNLRLTRLEGIPQRRADWKDINPRTATALIASIAQNRVTGHQYKYERPGIEVGYCFGRATFVHLKALSLGYKKDQIKKIWAIGPMQTGQSQWRYHVATMIRSLDGTWYVIDNVFGTALTAREWMTRMNGFSTNEKLHFYISNPEKFGPLPGKYSRADLGLDKPRARDIYNGFFVDLMDSFEVQHPQP